MRRFHFYIDDVRCEAPRELTVETRDEARAREMAQRMLGDSEHHRGVEVREQGERLFGLGSLSSPRGLSGG